jgi:hypothetical protein
MSVARPFTVVSSEPTSVCWSAQLPDQLGDLLGRIVQPLLRLLVVAHHDEAIGGRFGIAAEVGDAVGDRLHFGRVGHPLRGMQGLGGGVAGDRVRQRHDDDDRQQQTDHPPAQEAQVPHRHRRAVPGAM